MRVQMVIALVAGLVLVAVPLYLWRRPVQDGGASGNPSSQDAGALGADGGTPYVPLVTPSSRPPKVKLSPFKTIRCQDPGPGKTPPERCDHITFFEDALSRSIRDNTLCAPQQQTGATVSFVMEMDFRRKRWKLYRGKSSSLPAARTKELMSCVRRGMPAVQWGTIAHQHSKYVVNVIASYPPAQLF